MDPWACDEEFMWYQRQIELGCFCEKPENAEWCKATGEEDSDVEVCEGEFAWDFPDLGLALAEFKISLGALRSTRSCFLPLLR